MTQQKTNNRNKTIAYEYFISIGLLPPIGDRTERWVLHHKDIELRANDIERYNQWLIEDLIPVTFSEHQKIHMQYNIEHGLTDKYGHKFTDEEKQHLSNVLTGRPSPNKGNHFHKTPKAIEKTRQAHLGSHRSEETKRKLSEIKKAQHLRTRGSEGMHWYTNGYINKMCLEEDKPLGWTRGRVNC